MCYLPGGGGFLLRWDLRLRMKTTKPKVTLTLKPGALTPAQQMAWRKFFQKLLAEVKKEARK